MEQVAILARVSTQVEIPMQSDPSKGGNLQRIVHNVSMVSYLYCPVPVGTFSKRSTMAD